MGRKIVFFELNEVPFRIVDYYIGAEPHSTLARIAGRCRQYASYAEDETHLKPWKTWPTVHRGVIDQKHLLYDFGQPLDEVDRAYPPVWKILAKHGIRAGVFGSLHTYPMPEDPESYAFYFPDTFAAGAECFPKELSRFQEFNLAMARESDRNVSEKVPWKRALDVLAHSTDLGLRAATYASVGKQLVTEKLKPARLVRRRTYQTVLAFDIFMKQLRSTRPDFATFFTNHVASSMHRYWVALFPGDYEEVHFAEEWLKTYNREIWFSMNALDGMLKRLVTFVDGNPDYELWVTSSMGQEAVMARPIETQLHMKDRRRFLQALGLRPESFAERPAMVPQYNFEILDRAEGSRLLEALANVIIGGEPVRCRPSNEGDFIQITLGHENLEIEAAMVDGKTRTFDELGLENRVIADKSASTAYHIPQGTLLIYSADGEGTERTEISTLDITPAVLQNFGVAVPPYMNKAVSL